MSISLSVSCRFTGGPLMLILLTAIATALCLGAALAPHRARGSFRMTPRLAPPSQSSASIPAAPETTVGLSGYWSPPCEPPQPSWQLWKALGSETSAAAWCSLSLPPAVYSRLGHNAVIATRRSAVEPASSSASICAWVGVGEGSGEFGEGIGVAGHVGIPLLWGWMFTRRKR
jgi:hypothetical protein